MASFSSNEINSIQSLFDKNDVNSNINNNSRKSKILQKANSLVSLNKKNCSLTNKDKAIPIILMNKDISKDGRNQNDKSYNVFNRYNNTFNSKFDRKNKTFFNKMKNIKQTNNYSNYYVSSNLFHNDYISDFITGKKNLKNKDEKKEIMKETDNKIEELVKVLNIYTNKNLNKSQSQKLLDTEKTNENIELNNENNIKINENNVNNKDNLKRKLSKKTSEKYLIKGTKIISPFCDFARNHYLYKKIFYYSEKKKNLKSDSFLDNKLNIIYSENENQYKQNLIKLNEIYRRLGRNKAYNLEPSQSENKLRALKKRVEFMKRIVDYTYPNMVLTKIRAQESKKYTKNKNSINIVTSKIKRNDYNQFNMRISFGLKKSLNIQKCFPDKTINNKVT